MKHKYINRSPAIAMVILVMIIVTLACGTSNPTNQPQTNSSPSSTQAATNPTEASTAVEPTQAPTEMLKVEESYLGDMVEKDGYSLTAVAVQDPARPGMFYQAENGKKLIAVEVILANVSGNTLSANPLNASLIDTEGFTYTLELGGIDNQMATADLSVGQKVRGWVAFEVPDSAVAASIKYSTGLFGGTELKASLTTPPDGHQSNAGQSDTTSATDTFLGDTANDGLYGLRAVSVLDPAKPGVFYQAENSTKLIAVEVVLSNFTGNPLSVNALNAALIDTEGFVYEPELGGADVPQITTVSIEPGEQLRGWISFKVPENAVAGKIKYSTDGMFGNNFLEVGLSAPPSGHTPPALLSFADKPVLPKLGETDEQFGYSLVANEVVDPATPGILYEKREGYRLVAVDITLANISGDPLQVNPLSAYLVDSEGYVYEVELGGVDDQIDSMELPVDEKARGLVAFIIPEGSVPASVKYSLDLLGNGTFLHTGLNQ